jgi:hypothetical protein
MRNPKLLTLLLCLFAITSCIVNDDDDDNDRTKLLTEKNWKLTASTVDPAISINGSAPITNLFAQYQDCYKDNLTKFNKTGIIALDEGSTKCDASDPQTVSGTWAFNTDKTIISLTLDGETLSYQILELNKNTFKVSYLQRDPDTGINYTITETYAVQ